MMAGRGVPFGDVYLPILIMRRTRRKACVNWFFYAFFAILGPLYKLFEVMGKTIIVGQHINRRLY